MRDFALQIALLENARYRRLHFQALPVTVAPAVHLDAATLRRRMQHRALTVYHAVLVLAGLALTLWIADRFAEAISRIGF